MVANGKLKFRLLTTLMIFIFTVWNWFQDRHRKKSARMFNNNQDILSKPSFTFMTFWFSKCFILLCFSYAVLNVSLKLFTALQGKGP